MFRTLTGSMASVLLIGSTIIAQATVIQSAEPEYIATVDFQRISEYLTGVENSSGHLILRSNPEVRDGLYFVVKLDTPSSKLPAVVSLRMEIITTASKTLATYTYPIPTGGTNGRTIYAGITGADWPSEDTKPLAWHITLIDASGQSLGELKSFLWEMP